MTEEMDSKDVDILELLRTDSRMSMGQIGEKLKTSKATVSRRIAKLVEDEVIVSHSLEIDPSKLNVIKSLLGIHVKGSSLPHVINELRIRKEVRIIYKAFGDHHIVCEMYTNSVEELYDLIQTQLLVNPNIVKLEVDILVDRMVINENADLKLYRAKNALK
jgi:DNA-binding Lrp family transcriptional regulator